MFMCALKSLCHEQEAVVQDPVTIVPARLPQHSIRASTNGMFNGYGSQGRILGGCGIYNLGR